jgi:putative intracellular protease/amidase
MDAEMPFLWETKLRESGENFVNKPSFTDPIEIDGNFIAGQDPMSSESFAKAIVQD